jgi:hypothetical protein
MTFIHARVLTGFSSRCLGLLIISASVAAGCSNGAETPITPDCLHGMYLDGGVCAPNPPTGLSQSQIDGDTGWALLSGVVDVYNQNVAGRNSGAQDVTASCPVGGTVRITGTVALDSASSVTTVNLSYAMTNCKMSSASSTVSVRVALSLNGTIVETGSWHLPAYKSVNYQSTGLVLSGTDDRTGYVEGTMSETCDIAFSHDISGSGNTLDGTICGRNILDATGSGNDGGTIGGETGSGSGCQSGSYCYQWSCNGDSGCLSTNPTGMPSGAQDEGNDPSCIGLLTFGQKFWSVPPATQSCTLTP